MAVAELGCFGKTAKKEKIKHMRKIAIILATATLALNSARADLNSMVRQQSRLNQQAQMEGLRDIVIAVIVIGIVAFVIWKIAKKKK
jgi:hypothetical protein